MSTTTLSSKGQVIVPKTARDALHWSSGTKLDVEVGEDFVTLRRKKEEFRLPTKEELNRVAGCLKYNGSPLTIAEMDRRARQGFARAWRKK